MMEKIRMNELSLVYHYFLIWVHRIIRATVTTFISLMLSHVALDTHRPHGPSLQCTQNDKLNSDSPQEIIMVFSQKSSVHFRSYNFC